MKAASTVSFSAVIDSRIRSRIEGSTSIGFRGTVKRWLGNGSLSTGEWIFKGSAGDGITVSAMKVGRDPVRGFA